MIARRTAWPRRESALDLYTLACGAFLLIAPWLFGFVRPSGRLDAELVGLAVIVLSVAAIFAFADWEEWLKVLLGLWLIAAPWILGFAHTSAMHVSIGHGRGRHIFRAARALGRPRSGLCHRRTLTLQKLGRSSRDDDGMDVVLRCRHRGATKVYSRKV